MSRARRAIARAVLESLDTVVIVRELERRGWIRDRLPYTPDREQTLLIEPLEDAQLRAKVLGATPRLPS